MLLLLLEKKNYILLLITYNHETTLKNVYDRIDKNFLIKFPF